MSVVVNGVVSSEQGEPSCPVHVERDGMSVVVNGVVSSEQGEPSCPVHVERDGSGLDEFCIGCHGSVPFQAIQDVPKDPDSTIIHRFKIGDYKICGLPVPRLGQVLGLVGSGLTGKTVAFEILGGKLKPNLGRVDNPPDWEEVLTYFEGSHLYNYFTRIVKDKVKVLIKPQTVRLLPIAIGGIVGEMLDLKDERDMKAELCSDLELNQIIDRKMAHLSAGEIQRFAIGLVAIQNAEVYMFDEPSNYLDVKQRLKAAQVIRSLSRARPNSYVMVADHDLSVLGYLSDIICLVYKLSGAYGVVTLPFSVREGINIFLDGFAQTLNFQFQKESFTCEVAKTSKGNAEELEPFARYKYPSMNKTRGSFKLKVNEGEFTDTQIIVVLGENGTGKTTFIRMLAGILKSDTVGGSGVEMPEFCVSYKAQQIKKRFPYSVQECLDGRISDACQDPWFISHVMEPLRINELMNRRVMWLAKEELHGVALCLCLGKPADIYLIDEPSAFMTVEQIIIASKVIKRFIHHTKKTAFVVDHNFMLATYLADKVIVFEGSPSIDCTASSPHSLLTGMNLFLSHLDISCRRDPVNFQPVINKPNSACDREQKSGGHYYLDD